MKRFFSLMLAFLLVLPAGLPVCAGDEIPYEEWTHQCGENLFWELEDDGETLHISGTGVLNMGANYGEYNRSSPNSSGIRHVVIDEGCTEIRHVSYAREKLESVSLPETLRVIGGEVFSSTHALKEITIPEGVTEIGKRAFSSSALETVTLPSTLETLGARAFYNTKLTEVTVPENVKELPDGCFLSSTLQTVHLPEGLERIGNYCFAKDIEDSYCYVNEPDIIDMNIPDSIRFIGYNALPRGSQWYQQFDSQEYVIFGTVLYEAKENETGIYDIPDGVEMICETAFPYRDEEKPMYVKDVHFPDSISLVEGLPFDGTEFIENNPNNYIILHNGLLLRYVGKERVTHIPEGVLEIGQHAFEGNKTLISVHCPESLRRIQKYAFWKANIQDIRLNETLEQLDYRAFGHSALTEIYIPENVRTIGEEIIEQGGNKIIIGIPGSAAETYAAENSNTFELLTQPFNTGHDMTVIYGQDNWSFVNSSVNFGSGYYMNEDAREILLNDLQIDAEELYKPFGGSCYGLSLTMILAKAGLLSPSAMQQGAGKLADVAADTLPLSVINYYQFLSNSAVHQLNPTTSLTPEKKLLGMIRIAENVKNGEIPLLLSFSFSAGSHAVVGYGIESGEWEWNGDSYNSRILVWDPNAPNEIHDPSCIYYNTTTLNFCIPYYNVYYAGNRQTADGQITSYTNDLSVLRAYPYPFPAAEGDLNRSGTADIADAVLLSRILAEDPVGTFQLSVNADFDGDGMLTMLDFRHLILLLVGFQEGEALHQCGEDLFWELDGDTLRYYGTGVLDPYYSNGQHNRAEPYGSEKKEIRNIVIGEGCTGIRQGSFAEYPALETVTLPESLQFIGEYAFCCCENLREISFSDGLTEIGENAFACTGMTEITLPDTLRELPAGCFRGSRLEKVHLPAQLETVGEYCFSGNPLVSVDVPEMLREIGWFAFPEDSEWFQEIIADGYAVIGKVLCRVRDNGTGSYVIPDGVEIIPANAFEDMMTYEPIRVNELILPDSVTDIEQSAFDYTGFLENYPDDFVILGDGLLYKYIGSARVAEIPEGVKTICSGAFSSNSTLLSVQCPESLRTLKEYAFAHANLQEIFLNEGLERIGSNAFTGCPLQEIYIPAGVTEIGECIIAEGGMQQIVGQSGSEAEAYAMRSGNRFSVYTEPYSTGRDMTPVYGKDNWSFVNSSVYFGSGYYLTDEARSALLQKCPLLDPEELQEPFGGSCYGLSVCMILAKAGLLSPQDIMPGAETLADVTPNERSLSVINFHHFSQRTAEHQINSTAALQQEMKLLRMIRIAENVRNGQIPFLMSFSFPAGSHAVVGYGIEYGEWEWDGRHYDGRILIWDPNSPNELHESACLYYNENLHFCIPYYNLYYDGVYSEATGQINSFCNDLNALGAFPYPFPEAEQEAA